MIRYQCLDLEPVVLLYVFSLPVLLLLLATWYGYTLLLEKQDLAAGDDPLKNVLLFLAPALFVLAGALPFSALVPVANLGCDSQFRG